MKTARFMNVESRKEVRPVNLRPCALNSPICDPVKSIDSVRVVS